MHSEFLKIDWNCEKLQASLNTHLTARQRQTFGNRLLRLADYLNSLSPRQYNHAYLVERLVAKKPDCGTVACAFGHAVVSGKFPGINVRADYEFDENGICDVGSDNINFIVKDMDKLISKFNEFNRDGVGLSDPDFYDTDMEEPADVYFGPGTWDAIFAEDAYPSDEPTRATVVKRIRTVAKKVFGVTP